MLFLLTGCLSLDTLVHNPVHCSTVSTATCEDKPEWDQICTPCEDDYDWAIEYDWMENTLEDGQTVRAIDAATVTNVRVPTTDGLGELDTYFVPAHGEHAVNGGITILYSHGNYAGLEHYMPRVRYLHEAGFNVLFWDFRGYGKSEPAAAPDAEQWLSDSRLIRDIADDYAPDPERIILYANSVGGVATVEQGLYRPGCAMILEAPFTSIQTINAGNIGVAVPGSYITEGRFNNLEKIRDYSAPLLLMIGDLDVKFTVDEIRQMYDNAGTPAESKRLWVLEGVGHGIADEGIPEAGLTPYFAELDAFIADNAPACQ